MFEIIEEFARILLIAVLVATSSFLVVSTLQIVSAIYLNGISQMLPTWTSFDKQVASLQTKKSLKNMKRCNNPQCEHKYDLIKMTSNGHSFIAHEIKCVAEGCNHHLSRCANSDQALNYLIVQHNDWMTAKRNHGDHKKQLSVATERA